LGGGGRFPDSLKVRVPLRFVTHFSVLWRPLAGVAVRIPPGAWMS